MMARARKGRVHIDLNRSLGRIYESVDLFAAPGWKSKQFTILDGKIDIVDCPDITEDAGKLLEHEPVAGAGDAEQAYFAADLAEQYATASGEGRSCSRVCPTAAHNRHRTSLELVPPRAAETSIGQTQINSASVSAEH
jgi:hypothetical protein